MSVLYDQSCSECDAQLLRVEYKEGKSKLSGKFQKSIFFNGINWETVCSGDKTTAEGCIFCEAHLSALVEKHHAVFMRRRNQVTTK